MTEEQVQEQKKRVPANFVVLLEYSGVSQDESTKAPVLFKMLSEGHKDSQTARAWLRKNLSDLVKAHGEKSLFRIANMQPAVTAEVKMVSKLTIG